VIAGELHQQRLCGQPLGATARLTDQRDRRAVGRQHAAGHVAGLVRDRVDGPLVGRVAVGRREGLDDQPGAIGLGIGLQVDDLGRPLLPGTQRQQGGQPHEQGGDRCQHGCPPAPHGPRTVAGAGGPRVGALGKRDEPAMPA